MGEMHSQYMMMDPAMWYMMMDSGMYPYVAQDAFYPPAGFAPEFDNEMMPPGMDARKLALWPVRGMGCVRAHLEVGL
jgi:hypothetical protein